MWLSWWSSCLVYMKPLVKSLVIQNVGEVSVYLSSQHYGDKGRRIRNSNYAQLCSKFEECLGYEILSQNRHISKKNHAIDSILLSDMRMLHLSNVYINLELYV